MPLAIVITVLGLGLILAGVLWRQQTAPRRLILIGVGVFLLLLGGWKLLQAQDDGRRAEPRSWSAEPVSSPSLSVAFGPEDLPEADPPPPAAAASAPAVSPPAVSRSVESVAKPAPKPAVQSEPEPVPAAERRPVIPRAAPATPSQNQAPVHTPQWGRDQQPSASAVQPLPRKNPDHSDHDGEACCRWLPAEGGYSNPSRWQDADAGSAPSITTEPAPTYREGSACDVGRSPVQGGVCVEIRNALGQGQRSESLQLFVEGRPVGLFDLDQARPSQSLAVWLTYPGRFGYRLVGHVDYADGRYVLNSQGVFDARPGVALDVRITAWRDQVFLELDPWSADVSSAR